VNVSVDFHRLLPIVAVGAVALVAAVLVTRGVGGGSTAAGAQQVLDRALKEEPRSGALDVRVSFALQTGARRITVANTVVSGVGANAAPGNPSKQSFHFTENVAGKVPVSFDQLSTGGRGYIRVDGRWYRLSDAQYKRVFKPGESKSFVNALGFDPRRWISGPKIESTNGRVNGVVANQISGRANPDLVLSDLGFYEPARTSSVDAQKFADTIKSASRSGTMNLSAGKQDGILRKLSVNTVADASKSNPPLRASIAFTLGLDKVNQPVKVVEPTGALPPSRIAGIPRAKLGSQADAVLGAPTGPSGAGRHTKKPVKSAPRTKHAPKPVKSAPPTKHAPKPAKSTPGTKHTPKRSRQAYVSCVQSAQDLPTLERCQALLP
jgi:hypothetical protein